MNDWRTLSYEYIARSINKGNFDSRMVPILHPDTMVVCQFISDYQVNYGLPPHPSHLKERFNIDSDFSVSRYICDSELKHLITSEKTRYDVQHAVTKLQTLLTEKRRIIEPGEYLQPFFDLQQSIQEAQPETAHRLSNYGDALAFYMSGKGNETVAHYGIPSFDRITGGISAGQFIVLFANTYQGKSTLARTLAGNMAIEGKTVLYLSLEESGRKSVIKTLSTILQTRPRDIFENRLGADAHRKLCHFPGVRGDVIFIDNVQSKTIEELDSLTKRYRPDVIVVDQIPLFVPGSSSKWEDMSTVSRQLKAFGQSYPIPIIGLTQATRKAKSQKTPSIEDAMAFAYAMAQDADVLIFLHPDEAPDGYVKKKCTFLKVRDFEGGQTIELVWKVGEGIIEELGEIKDYDPPKEFTAKTDGLGL